MIIDRKLPLLPFAIELPYNLSKISNIDIHFFRKTLENKRIKSNWFFNKELFVELSCYLNSTNTDILRLGDIVLQILEGLAFKNRIQIKKLDILIKDIKKDPFNRCSPFIGVVLREIKELTEKEIQEKRIKYDLAIGGLNESGV